MHRRHSWGRMVVVSLMAFLFAAGAYSNAESQGATPPGWFFVIVIVLGTLTVVGIVAAVLNTVLLRRRPAAVRAQAVPLAAHHPSGTRAHHYPPLHRVPWALAWVGMLLFLAVGVVSVPGLVDGVTYLTGHGKAAQFDPVSYQTVCSYRGGCDTVTDGILETGGAGVQASWPDVVPLGKPFLVRKPTWTWGLGEALISSTGVAVVAIVVSLLLEGGAVFVLVSFVRLTRNWLRHRRKGSTPASGSASAPA